LIALQYWLRWYWYIFKQWTERRHSLITCFKQIHSSNRPFWIKFILQNILNWFKIGLTKDWGWLCTCWSQQMLASHFYNLTMCLLLYLGSPRRGHVQSWSHSNLLPFGKVETILGWLSSIISCKILYFLMTCKILYFLMNHFLLYYELLILSFIFPFNLISIKRTQVGEKMQF